MGLIILNCVAITFETIDRIYSGYQSLFDWLEFISVGIFSAEYSLRVWSCTSSPDYKHPVFGRLRFVVSPMVIVDLLAIAVVGIGMFALPAGILGSAFVLEDVFHGSRRVGMRNHFIICGMGKIGVQVMERLLKLGKEAVVVEQNENNIYLSAARSHDVPVVIGDIRMAETLEDAGVREAGRLIALSDKDMANLEAALNAQASGITYISSFAFSTMLWPGNTDRFLHPKRF